MSCRHSRSRRCARLLLVLVFCGLACSDGDEKSPTGVKITPECSDDLDCDADQLCLFQHCRETCADDSQCDNGAHCIDTGRGSACANVDENSCTRDADCPARTQCFDGLCLPSDGGFADAEVISIGTSDSGPSPDSGTDAGRNSIAQNAPTGSGSCSPKAQRCLGKLRQVCSDSGSWQPMETCPRICMPSGCTNGCTEGVRSCNDRTIVMCKGGRMVDQEQCPFACQSGACTGDCEPGTTQCSDGGVATCAADGRWSTPAKCLNACVDGACAGVCTPGAQRCAGSMGYQACSSAGEWGANQTCSGQACVDGMCRGDCTPGARRCKPATASDIESCSAAGKWEAATACQNQACIDGMCRGECVPGGTRCDPADTTLTQVCDAHGAWMRNQQCSGELKCASEGRCVQPSCPSGMTPDWTSAAGMGGDPSWNDPRWGADPPVKLDAGFDVDTAGYIAVLDRSAGTLALTFRVSLGASEAPEPTDQIYVGILSNMQNNGVIARAVTLSPPRLPPSAGPTPITNLAVAQYEGAWSTPATPTAMFVRDASAWRGGSTDTLSWTVSLKLDLTAAGVDVTRSFRMALRIHIDGRGELITPGDRAVLSDIPTEWAVVSLAALPCVSRVSLFGRPP